MRVAEPTKVCADCKTRKPWSEFHAKVKWDDGTMRQPLAYCKECQRARVRVYHAKKRKDREWTRIRNRRTWAKIKSDPERYGAELERTRAFHARERRQRGAAERPRCSSRFRAQRNTSCLVAAAPFREWLRDVLERDEATIVDLAARFGIQDRRLREILNGQPTVELATVERALIAEGVETLMDIYSDLYER